RRSFFVARLIACCSSSRTRSARNPSIPASAITAPSCSAPPTVGHRRRVPRGRSLAGRLRVGRRGGALLAELLGALLVAAHPPDLLVRHRPLAEVLGPLVLDGVGAL